MVNTTRTRKGFCSYTNEHFEVQEPIFGELPTLHCPLCEEVVFDIGGTLYHGKKD
jgi:hypothetical protein